MSPLLLHFDDRAILTRYEPEYQGGMVSSFVKPIEHHQAFWGRTFWFFGCWRIGMSAWRSIRFFFCWHLRLDATGKRSGLWRRRRTSVWRWLALRCCRSHLESSLMDTATLLPRRLLSLVAVLGPVRFSFYPDCARAFRLLCLLGCDLLAQSLCCFGYALPDQLLASFG